MTMVVGYRHTGIIVENMEQSLVFYQDFLGLEVIQEFWDDSDYICRITCLEDATAHFVKLRANDGTVLELLEYPTHRTQLQPQPIHNVGVLHIAFEVATLEPAEGDGREKQPVGVVTLPTLREQYFKGREVLWSSATPV